MTFWKRLRAPCFAGTLALLTLCAGIVSADTYTLNIDHCTNGCGTGPYGTITVTDVTVGTTAEVQVSVQLASGVVFVNTGGTQGLGGSFLFNITGGPFIADQTIPTGWSLESDSAGTIHMDGFGDFGYGLNCTACATGGSTAASDPSSLLFDISGNFTAASLAALSSNGNPDVYFAADVYSAGNTGPVGAGTMSGTTPEPTAIVLLGSSMIGIGAIVRRRRRNRLVTQS